MFVTMLALVLAMSSPQAPGLLPGTTPVLLGAPAAADSPPPHLVAKQPGHYSKTDWQRVIDSTWGPGLSVSAKLAIFDSFWSTIDDSFACFNSLDVNWDSLRAVYRAEVEDTVSRGRFAAIMNHLAMALREGHTIISDITVNYGTQLLPGVPLWVVGAWMDAGHFGAGLTPLPDSSLLVYRVAANHPLGLKPGDMVMGFDRRRWVDILRELEEAQLPIRQLYTWGSCSTAMTYSLLNAAGMNWHLFDTIDIVKYSTGDTVHLPTSWLEGQGMHLYATDQMDIPGVPMPSTDSMPAATYGVVSGTRIGYIYCWRWYYDAGARFYDAVNALTSDPTLKGIIIDFRFNQGGNMFLSDSGLNLLFHDSTATICFTERSDPENHHAMRVVEPAGNFTVPGNGVGYDKPIAVLVGPGAVSSGDQVAYRMTFHPRVQTFGLSTNAAFNGRTGLSVFPGWYALYARVEACLASDTTYFLTHREFPVDVPVWHTRDAVANGKDAVVEAAIAWVDSTSGIAEATPKHDARTTMAPTIIHGVLYLREGTSSGASPSCLLDAAGRNVMILRPGANDVSRLGPGVYFVRSPETGDGRPGVCTRKVVLTK